MFQYVFWKQQKESLKRKGKCRNGMRWHPLIIKWCHYMRHQSGKPYDTLRDLVIISLPSQRTLQDYSNSVKAGAGFSVEVDHQLLEASKLLTSPSYHSLIAILIDEMHIKEDLVYNKQSGKLIGFVNLGDIKNHLTSFEKSLVGDGEEECKDTVPLANSMVAIIVKGLFTMLRFVYVQFPCTSLNGEQLFNPFWDSVLRLERLGLR